MHFIKYSLILSLATLSLFSNQLSNKAQWFSAKDQAGNSVKYAGQAATNSTILLTPSNGFFSSGVRATGKSKNIDSDTTFIKGDFAALERWSKPDQSLRWHLWTEKTGKVSATIELQEVTADTTLSITFAGQTHEIKAKKTVNLQFSITKPGKQTFTIKPKNSSGRKSPKFITAELKGKPLQSAKLLRARWRPAAVHSRFLSTKVPETQMWVMVSKSMSNTSSYSPITTPFGYYGASFDVDNRTGTSMNFSMWSYGKGSTPPPIQQWSHLIAAGSPEAEFSGFGHEGTGVKIRGPWQPLKSRPKELIQALRVERGDKYDTYYGYYLDPETKNWNLFAAGNKWKKGKKSNKSLWPGSFVEVPGPPARQRSGDILREVFRKGWAISDSGQWHPMNSTGRLKPCKNVNKFWRIDKSGWFSTGMGGMEHFDYLKPTPVILENPSTELPDYLSPEKTKQLYQMPVTFGTIKAKASEKKAKLLVNLPKADKKTVVYIYYGEEDCLTFAPRKLNGTERGSAEAINANCWEHSKKCEVISKNCTVELSNLKPKTEYYYRVLVINSRGKQWSPTTQSFKTK